MAFLGFTSSVYLMEEATVTDVLQIYQEAAISGSSAHSYTSLDRHKKRENRMQHSQALVSSIFCLCRFSRRYRWDLSHWPPWTGCSGCEMKPTRAVTSAVWVESLFPLRSAQKKLPRKEQFSLDVTARIPPCWRFGSHAQQGAVPHLWNSDFSDTNI